MPRRVNITNTAQAWDFLKPRLRGKWYRLECQMPDGLGDAIGFWNRHTHLVEIKVLKDRLRASQRIIIDDAASESVPIWIARFTKLGELQWQQHDLPCVPPPFYIL